jgi:hypothetical protein
LLVIDSYESILISGCVYVVARIYVNMGRLDEEEKVTVVKLSKPREEAFLGKVIIK